MPSFVEERSLAERLKPRMAVEEQFVRTGRKFRSKSFIFRHEDVLITPWLKLGLRAVRLYSRGLHNATHPVIRRLTLDFADLPAAFDGFEILHISDLHIDGVDGLTEVLVPMLAGLRPDLCVITGDYRFQDEGPCEEVYRRMRPIIGSIRAKEGVFGILGNHDSAEIAFALEDMGLRMLVNEAVELHRGHASIWLSGVDDPFDFRCDDLTGALSSVPPDRFKILLAHSPQLFEEASDGGVQLYLCGHTHAGQVRFPFIGSLRHNADCPKEYSFGHWKHGNMHGYTSAGTGCSMLPIRFGCPAELVLIRLRRHAHSGACGNEK